jgi:toxin-antitoxin system PIN domain toxin
MISFDTNLLLYSLNKDCPEHEDSREFFSSLPTAPSSVVVCELVLIELYVLLRNSSVVKNPLGPEDAVSIVQTFRQHPGWTLCDYPGGNSTIMEDLWRMAAQPNIGRRVIFDSRLALTLRYHGVTDFATCNESHFGGFGFNRVWNPLLKTPFK